MKLKRKDIINWFYVAAGGVLVTWCGGISGMQAGHALRTVATEKRFIETQPTESVSKLDFKAHKFQ